MLSMDSRAAILSPESPKLSSLGVFGRDMRDDDGLRVLLPEAVLLPRYRLGAKLPDGIAVLAGTPETGRARAIAAQRGIPCSILDDGIFRAPRGTVRRAPRLSLIAIEAGESPARSSLTPPERLLDQDGWRTPRLRTRAQAALAALVAARVGGAWWAPDPGAAALELPSECALIVPGRSPDSAFESLLDIALRDHAAERVVVVKSGEMAGWHDVAASAAARGCCVIDRQVNPWTLIDAAAQVYAGDHEFGFLALLGGRTVHCIDRPFYAGWGVTIDAPTVVPRARQRSVEDIFAATCLLATRYADPFSHRPCSFEDMLALVGNWRRVNNANRQIAVCVGMSFWKRRRIAEFLASSDGRPRFARRAEPAARLAQRSGGMAAVWASREPPGLRAAAAARDVPVLTVEDGFLRSVGLGADFMPAASLVVDRSGIYYDPTRPSDLERLLAETAFDDAMVERARRLIAQLVARGITKYNIGGAVAPELGASAGRRRILVPGQVEDDRSVALGGAGITRNLELLERVRRANRDAFIVYKPHPDVDAGHRRGAIPDEVAASHADRILRGVSSAALLSVVDEIHTLTSLVGFEALLRGRRVVVYGQPFYAGWGLTADHAPPPRRSRNLTLEQLVAGTLILYPRYLDPVTRLPCGPEIIIDRLSDPTLWRAGPLVTLRRLQGAAARRLAAWSTRLSASRGRS
jgi:capsular polysaccharide export protein